MMVLVSPVVRVLAIGAVVAAQITILETSSIDVTSLMSHLTTATAYPSHIRRLAARETQAYSDTHSDTSSETKALGIVDKLLRRNRKDDGIAITITRGTITIPPTRTREPFSLTASTCTAGLLSYENPVPIAFTARGRFNVFVIETYALPMTTFICVNSTVASYMTPSSTEVAPSASSHLVVREKRINGSESEFFIFSNLWNLSSNRVVVHEKVDEAPNATNSSSFSSAYFNPITDTGLVSSDSLIPNSETRSNSITPTAVPQPTVSATQHDSDTPMAGTMSFLRPDFTPKMRTCTPLPVGVTGTTVGSVTYTWNTVPR